jgi:glutamine synthetase adenylyltransferase
VIDKSLSELVVEDLIEPATEHRLHKELLRQHDNTFLWVALIMKQLREDAENGASEMELIAALRDNSIYALYAKFLDQCVKECRNLSMVSARTPKTEFTPLMLAVMHQQPEIVEALCNMRSFSELYVTPNVYNKMPTC